MPGTNLSNILYRLALPFNPVRPERRPELIVQGNPLHDSESYLRILRRHHVLGSSTLLKDNDHQTVIHCSSQSPEHQVTDSSMFRVASITKMAAALAVFAAAEEGVLSPDLPFLSFFPEISDIPELKNVTLKHLLSHTSGLTDPANLEEALNHGIPFPDIITGCRSSEPGESFRYSNLGYGLIGSLLEKVYHEPVSDIFHRLVFSPLGMNATLDASGLNPEAIVPITRIPIRPPFSPVSETRITKLGSVPLKDPDPLRHYGHTAGAMYLDIFSLEKLVSCLMNNGTPVVSASIGSCMKDRKASYGKLSPTLSYGYGLLIIEDPSISSSRILGHQGFAYGCADGAFWEESTGRIVLFLNGGASEARKGRLGLCNYDVLRWSLRKEMPLWSGSAK